MNSPQPSAQRCPKPRRFIRPIASLLSIAFTLPLFTLAKPAQAQVGGEGESCYAIADNNPSGGGNGGIGFPDTLAIVDFTTSTVTSLGIINGPNGPITNIEAATSRPAFNELIVANGNEIGRVNPATSQYTPLGVLSPFTDFDAIAIDLQSPNQTRLIGVSKDRNNASLDNVIVEVILEIDSSGITTGLSSVTRLAQISDAQFPASRSNDTINGIDGIAIADNGTVFGVANGGINALDQRLVIIDTASGSLRDLGPFEDQNGRLISDVEDISIDLFGDLFISSGSNFTRSANTAYLITFSLDGSPARARKSLLLSSAGTDFEASACLRTVGADEGRLLVVKRITAVTRNGEEVRFDEFVDQTGETTDNQLFDLTNGTFPVGLVQTPTALRPNDEVEYTVYIYNPTRTTIGDTILCDPIQPPSVLQSASVSFSEPTTDLALSFVDRPEFARAPLAPEDTACEAIVAGGQFPSGPPGPTGGLDIGAGGGIVTDQFLIAPSQISATRFRITVGQGNFE